MLHPVRDQTSAASYTTQEMMVAARSRLIRKNECVFIGAGMPLLAGVMASRRHAPDSVIINEAGLRGSGIGDGGFSISGPGGSKKRFPWYIAPYGRTRHTGMVSILKLLSFQIETRIPPGSGEYTSPVWRGTVFSAKKILLVSYLLYREMRGGIDNGRFCL